MTAVKSVSFGAELDKHVASGKLAKCLICDVRRFYHKSYSKPIHRRKLPSSFSWKSKIIT